jgi:uncharacterized Zn-binding protein involved in type VI secretion
MNAVRLGDLAMVVGDSHGCPGCPHVCIGPTIDGSNDVFINSLNAIRKGDPGIHAACCGPNTFNTNEGSPNVFVNGKPLVRLNDETKHCGGTGHTITGSPNVFVN